MSAEPAQNANRYQEVMDQMERNHRAAIEATRTGLAQAATQQGRDVSRDLGQLPVPSTPNVAAKDLVHKYGREATQSAERTPAREPEP